MNPREVSCDVVVPLRAEILRPGLPLSQSRYPDDEASATIHLAIREDRELLAIGSAFQTEEGWRLRGMATVPSRRGEGLGGAILEGLVARIENRGGATVWCNARLTAERFYDRHGFIRTGDVFELPGIGPHIRMERRLDSANGSGSGRDDPAS